MIEARTLSGFEFKFDEDAADDMEVLEKLAKLDSGNMGLLPEIIVDFLGEEQKKALYEHCRTEKGRVSARRVLKEFKMIFEAVSAENNKVKN